MSKLNSFNKTKHFIARRISELSPSHASEFSQNDILHSLRLYRAHKRPNSSSLTPKQRRAKVLPTNSHTPQQPSTVLVREDDDSKDFQKFIASLNHLQDLKFELELLFDLRKAKQLSQSEKTSLGNFIQIQEKLKEVNTDYIKNIKDCCKILRNVLKTIAEKGGDSECILLEMIWRVMIKQIDSIIELSDQKFLKSLNKSEEHIYQLKSAHKIKRNALKESLLKTQTDASEIIKNNEETIKSLHCERSKLDRMLVERDIQLAELTEIDTRDVACAEMNRILVKIGELINEAEHEKVKQISALSSISRVMNIAEKKLEPPVTVDNLCQTNLNFPTNPFPELSDPILSTHPLYKSYHLYEKNEISMEKGLKICTKVLSQGIIDIPFHKQLLLYLLNKRLSPKNAMRTLLGLADLMNQNQSSTVQRVFCNLMGGLPWPMEQFLLKVYSMVKTSCFLSIAQFLDFLKSSLPNERQSCERILKMANWTHNVQSHRIPKELLVILCRFHVTLEKSKKGLKQVLDIMDPNNEGTIKRTVFVDISKQKLGFLATDSEIHMLADYFGRDLINRFEFIEKYHMLGLSDKSKAIHIEKEEIFMCFLKEYYNRFEDFKQSLSFMKACDLSEISEKASNLKEDPNKMINIYTDTLLGKSLDSVLLENLNLILPRPNQATRKKSKK